MQSWYLIKIINLFKDKGIESQVYIIGEELENLKEIGQI